MRFNKPLLCNCINVRYSLLTFCVMYAKVNEARVNSGYTSIFLRIYGRWKILFSRFRKIDFSSFKMTFAKSFIYKVLSISFIYRQVFKVLKKFYFTVRKSSTLWSRPFEYFSHFTRNSISYTYHYLCGVRQWNESFYLLYYFECLILHFVTTFHT